MVGVSTAVGKGVAKSSMPPLQKAGVIVGGAVLGGVTHSLISTYNRSQVNYETKFNLNVTNKSTSSSSDVDINKFIDDYLTSPLETLLFNVDIINAVCLSLMIILVIQIIFKLHLKDSIKLNLSNILSVKVNNNLEYYINKIIILNKKMSVFFIWLILILIILALSISIFVSDDLFNNIDNYIAVHNHFWNK